MYITVKRAPGLTDPVTFSIRMQESMPEDTFSESLAEKIALYDDTLHGSDAHATSF